VAAATNLVDAGSFEEHIKPKIDPSRIIQAGIQCAGGAQNVRFSPGTPNGMVSLSLTLYEPNTLDQVDMGVLRG